MKIRRSKFAEDQALRRPSVQYVQLMARSQVLYRKRCSRPEKVEEHPPNQIQDLEHPVLIARFAPSGQADGMCDMYSQSGAPLDP
jgi:hypothetical protein